MDPRKKQPNREFQKSLEGKNKLFCKYIPWCVLHVQRCSYIYARGILAIFSTIFAPFPLPLHRPILGNLHNAGQGMPC